MTVILGIDLSWRNKKTWWEYGSRRGILPVARFVSYACEGKTLKSERMRPSPAQSLLWRPAASYAGYGMSSSWSRGSMWNERVRTEETTYENSGGS